MTNETPKPMVLVTGASGFIAMHCILQLLQQGYPVRGTLRTPSRGESLRRTFANHIDANHRLTFVTADLMHDEGWPKAVEGCTYVLHVASPLPSRLPKDEDEVIIPAREGTLRVLKAAADAGVKRVVLTSSIAAMIHGYPRDGSKIFNEDDWSKTDDETPAYPKSKTLAERAAWDFVDSLPDDQPLELATINPGLVLGPILDEDFSTSGEVVRRLMRREVPGVANFGFAPVDVRDVAAAHLLAMTSPEAAGQRFCCALEFVWVREVAEILDRHFGPRGYKIPRRHLPDFLLRLAAIFDKTLRLVVGGLGQRTDISTERIRTMLNWQPRSLEEMVVDMGESMIKYGVV